MKSICVPCNIEFPSLEELEAHEKSGHVTKGSPITPAPAMTPEFEQTMQEITEDKKKKEEEIKRLQAEHEKKSQQSIDKKPLKLEYKYTGNCECGSEPLTIITDTPAGLYAIAFCIPENRQIESIQVERIIQPKKMKIEKNEAVEAEIVAEPKKDVIPKKRKRK